MVNGVNEKAELNITGGASDSLTVDATSDAIESQGDINISGDGTVNSTASRADGIDAEGNLTISGGGTVNATGSSDGIEVGGNELGGNVTITGGGSVTASSDRSSGMQVDGALSVTDSTLVATGAREGLYVYKGVTFDHATVRVAARNPGNEAFGLFTDEDDIVIRNGSVVEAFAEGAYSAGIYTQNCEEGGAGGHMFVSESVVKAVARYLEGEGQDGGDIAMNYASADVDGDEQLGRNAGIVVLTKNGMSPAKLSIVRSTVTAEGDTAAILVCATSEDGSVAGMIELEGSIIQTPAGGHVSDYNAKHEVRDGVEYDVGQTIGLSGETITSLDSADIAKSAVIVPEEVPVPAPSGSSTSGGANVTQATARKTSVAGSAIPQTGDASLTGVLSAGFAGLAALVSGLFVSRKRG